MTTEVRDRIVRTEREAETRDSEALLPARYTLVFSDEQTPGPLAVLDAAGPLPTPSVGEAVHLHGHEVRVLESETSYARSDDGRAWVHVTLTVAPTAE